MECSELIAEEKENSYLQGRKAGEHMGYEKAQKELYSLFHLLYALSDKLIEHKERLLLLLKGEMIEFALTVCEKIVRSELSQKEKLAKLIDSYLERGLEGECVKILLCPEDLILLDPFLKEQAGQGHPFQEKKLQFLSDSALQKGDFKVETKTSIINASLSRQIEDLKSKILRP